MNQETDTQEPIDWWLITRTLSGEIAASVALEAILGAEERLRYLGRAEIRQAFTAIAEGTWWVAALDEQLLKGLGGYRPALASAYKSDRDEDEDGQYIRAFLWARNRHAHQLPFTTSHDDDLAQRRSGVRSKFSQELIWEASEKLPPVEKQYADKRRRSVYDQLLAGQPINDTLYHCARWFNKAAGRDTAWESSQVAKSTLTLTSGSTPGDTASS